MLKTSKNAIKILNEYVYYLHYVRDLSYQSYGSRKEVIYVRTHA